MDVFDLFAKISLDDGEFKRGLDSAKTGMSGIVSGMGVVTSKCAELGGKLVGTIDNIGKTAVSSFTKVTAGAGAVVSSIGLLGKKAVDSFADYEQLKGGVETLFKGSADAVKGYAQDAFKTAGMSANEYMTTVTSFSASLLQSLGRDTDKTAEKADQAITDMADNANKMGTSMESVQNAYQGFAKQNYTMLDNLKLGYGGTKQEMQRLLADAEKLTGQKYDLSSYADIIDAIHAIQDEYGITGTTAKEASETISGSISSMKGAWSNWLTGMSDDTQDFEKLTDDLVESVVTVAGNIAPRIQQLLPRMVEGVTQLVQALVPSIPPLIQSLVPVIIESAGALADSIGTITGEIVNMIAEMAPGLIETAVGVVTSLIESIGANTEGFATAAESIMRTLFESFGTVVDTLLPIIKELAPTIAEGFLMYQEAFREAGLKILTALVTGIAENIDSVLETGGELLEKLSAAISENLPALAEAATQIIQALMDFAVDNADMLVDMALEIVDAIVKFIGDNVQPLLEGALQIIKALADGLGEKLPELVPAVIDIVLGIVDALIDNMGLLWDAALALIVGLAEGLIAALPDLIERLPEIIQSIVDYIVNNAPKILETGVKLIIALGEGLIKAIPQLVMKIPEIVVSLVKGFLEMREKFLEVGKNIVDGIKQGIIYKWKQFTTWAKGIFKGLTKTAEETYDIHSPSKVFQKIGENLMLGMQVGMRYQCRSMDETIQAIGGEMLERSLAMVEEIEESIKALRKEKVSKRNKELREAELAALEQQKEMLESSVDAYEKAYESIIKAQDSLENKLKSFGDLMDKYTEENVEFIKLADIREDINALTKYGDALEELKARGVSQEFIDEIISMNIDDALGYTDVLLNETDAAFGEYISLWQLKQDTAKRIATEFYADQVDTLTSEFSDELLTALGALPDESEEIGENVAKGIADGMKAATDAVTKQAGALVEAALKASKAAAKIKSPSALFRDEVGKMMAAGVGLGFDAGMDGVMADISASISGGIKTVSAQPAHGYDDGEVVRLLRQLVAKNSDIVLAPSAALGRVVSRSTKMYGTVTG